MNKITYNLITILFLSSTIFSLVVTTGEVLAQESGEEGVTISPAVVEIEVGDSYVLTIGNNSGVDRAFKITPRVFEINVEERRVFPANTGGTDLSQYIRIQDDDLIIPARSSSSITITYLDKPDNAFMGVTASEIAGGEQTFSIAAELSSIVLDLEPGTKVVNDVLQTIEIEPKTSFLGINLGNEYTVRSKVENNSSSIIRASGEITASDGEVTIKNFALTNLVSSTLFPEDERTQEFMFIDDRSVSDRFGNVEFGSRINVNGESITVSNSVFSIPIGAYLLLILFVPIVVGGIVFHVRRTVKKKK